MPATKKTPIFISFDYDHDDDIREMICSFCGFSRVVGHCVVELDDDQARRLNRSVRRSIVNWLRILQAVF